MTALRQLTLAFAGILCCFILTSAPVHAQTQPASTGPGEAQSAGEPMRVVVMEVEGTVRVRENPDSPWKPATVNMVLGEQAEFRTGPRSAVTCAIPPDQIFTLDRLGTVSVLEAIKEGKTIKTDLALKYGRVRFDVEAAGVEHRAVIRSPSSTLAVRGTNVVLYDQPPFLPEAQSFHGRAEFGYSKRTVPVGSNAFAKVVAGSNGAADTALAESVVDPRQALSRTATDQELIENETSRGAVLSFDSIANIKVIRGGPGPLKDAQFSANPPGGVNFYLRWIGNADLNLTVTFMAGDPNNPQTLFNFQPTDFLYPGFGLDVTPNGGHIAFDHRGGPNGGTETGFFANATPGIYGLSARNISGDTAEFKFNAVLADGTQLRIFTDLFTIGKQVQRTLPPGQEIVAIVPVPDSVLLDNPVFGPEPPPQDFPSASTPSSRATAARKAFEASLPTVKPLQTLQPLNFKPPTQTVKR